jgi:hypothetical protein
MSRGVEFGTYLHTYLRSVPKGDNNYELFSSVFYHIIGLCSCSLQCWCLRVFNLPFHVIQISVFYAFTNTWCKNDPTNFAVSVLPHIETSLAEWTSRLLILRIWFEFFYAFQFSLKSDRHYRRFVWKPTCIFAQISSLSRYVSNIRCREKSK